MLTKHDNAHVDLATALARRIEATSSVRYARYLIFAVVVALIYYIYSQRGDAVFSHFHDLETSFVQNTKQGPLFHRAGGSNGGGGTEANSADVLFYMKQRVDPDLFRATAIKMIEDFILAQGGKVVGTRATGGNSYSPGNRSEGADTAGQVVHYQWGPYRGSISIRVTVFDRSNEAGHVYLELVSFK